ncbi:16433_t:CDS:2 [Entrophospora sp. SA101]|nr:16433_t:CDS:2 [Entrophospora sp. SA101]CAJ0846179.1 17869_t:CDS:2 [Entrophospora sp. SA101]
MGRSKLSSRRNGKGKRKRSLLSDEDRYYESSTSSTTTICVRNMPPSFFRDDVNNMFKKYGHLRSNRLRRVRK